MDVIGAFALVGKILGEGAEGDRSSIVIWEGADVSRVLGIRVEASGMWEIVQCSGELYGEEKNLKAESISGGCVDALISALQNAKSHVRAVVQERRNEPS